VTQIAAADVVVVGCGVIGLATAERLVASNRSVVLVDGQGVANGPSGASGGLVRAFDPAHGGSWAGEGLDVYLRRGWRGTWPEVREDGSLVLLETEAVPRAAANVRRLRRAGHVAELLSAREMQDRFPHLAVPSDLVGVHEARAGWLPAREVAQAMLRDAGPGATVLEGVSATAVITSGTGVAGVRTPEGDVAARAVLLAAGTASSRLAETAGVHIPLRTRAIGYCLLEPAGGPPEGMPAFVDTTTGAWTRRWGSGSTVLAGVASTVCDVPPVVSEGAPPAEQERVRRVVEQRWPGLAGARVVGGVAAYDAFPPDGNGSVIVWSEPQGLVTATGWNGGGFKIAPAVGNHAAAWIEEVLA